MSIKSNVDSQEDIQNLSDLNLEGEVEETFDVTETEPTEMTFEDYTEMADKSEIPPEWFNTQDGEEY